MGSSKRFVKDPNSILDFGINWTSWLDSDTIASSTWTVPTGITSTLTTNSTTHSYIWLSVATLGVEYELSCRIVTAGGRTEDCTITISVESK